MSEFRIEKDSMGEVKVPADMYFGAQTQRAIDNFKVSNHVLHPRYVKAVVMIKKSAALANKELKTVDAKLTDAISNACDEIIKDYEKTWHRHFPIDLFQTGSGTSSNMNANEVIANIANIALEGQGASGTMKPIHPNDHVNWGQSSNCVMPSAVSVADRIIADDLLNALRELEKALAKKEEQFKHVIKLGRTHLQDAVPMTLGQEFSAFKVQIHKNIKRLEAILPDLEEIPVGGTAIGTGIASHKDFGTLTCKHLSQITKIPFKSAPNKFEGIAARDSQVALMGVVNTIAVSLMKIANDLRILASGARGGIGEIEFPELQPGSSIMPGKVNPVIAEMMIQVCAHVMGKAVSVTVAGQNSPLQLNMMIPLLAHETVTSMELLTNAIHNFINKALIGPFHDGITADEKRCLYWIDFSLALITPLKNVIGYNEAARLAHKAHHEKRLIKDIVLEAESKGEIDLKGKKIDDILDPKTMLGF